MVVSTRGLRLDIRDQQLPLRITHQSNRDPVGGSRTTMQIQQAHGKPEHIALCTGPGRESLRFQRVCQDDMLHSAAGTEVPVPDGRELHVHGSRRGEDAVIVGVQGAILYGEVDGLFYQWPIPLSEAGDIRDRHLAWYPANKKHPQKHREHMVVGFHECRIVAQHKRRGRSRLSQTGSEVACCVNEGLCKRPYAV